MFQDKANAQTLKRSNVETSNVEMGLMRTGDCNNDNVVNVSDFNILKSTFGKSQGDPGYDDRADFTGDHVVNVSDFNFQKANFGTSGSPPLARNADNHLLAKGNWPLE
jgi:hypothetical protein